MPTDVETVVFDLGGVLLDWNPEHLFRPMFGGDDVRMRWFLENVCSAEWNAEQDRGRPFAVAIAEAIGRYPEDEAYIRAYRERWIEMVSGPLDGTVEILSRLRARATRLLGLSNWSGETFPLMRREYAFLSWFEGIVVSGEEGVAKPDPRIFERLISRYRLTPGRTLFIDDSACHTAAALSLGFEVWLFTDPGTLEGELIRRGLLAPDRAAG